MEKQRGILMKMRGAKVKFITVSAVLLIIVLLLCTACSDGEKNNSDTVNEMEEEKIFLITDDTPNCSMIISDEVFKYLNKDDDYSYILDMMNDYFNVVINEEIEPNVVYIRAVSEKIDAEVRLSEVYEASSKASLLLQIAEAGKSVFNEYNFDMVNENKAQQEPEKTDNELYNELISSLKTIANKAAIYGVNAIKDEFKEKTRQIYHTSDKITSGKNVDRLKYNDYYIDINNDTGISIVCGSEETVVTALDYFLTEYIEMGTSGDGDYIIDVPDSKIHVGHYLSDTIGNQSVDKFSIVYYCDDKYYDSRENAKYLKEYFLRYYGVELLIKNTDCSSENVNRELKYKIVIGKSSLVLSEKYYSKRLDIMDYQILQQGNNLYILGGSDMSIRYAIDYMIDEFFSKEVPVPNGFFISGSIYGKNIIQKYGDSNLRIMSNNVWYNKKGNTWLSEGFDCSNQTRYREMAKVYLAYTPDVISFQELYPSSNCSDFMLREINKGGRNYQFVDGAREFYVLRNHTPIIYNTDTLELKDSGSHVFSYGSNTSGSNIGTKSYTWAYFRQKSTGYKFIVFSTHLWWKQEVVEPGSIQYRIDQMTEICKKANELIKEYSCSCYVMGDFNCKTSSTEFATMGKYNFSDCHEIATEFASNSPGRYICKENSFSYKPNAGTYKKNGIDHIMVKNLKKARVLSYNYALPNFYGRLSDHAPVYIDVKTRT